MPSSQQDKQIVPSAAVILAAGRGARLAPLTNDIPKCLLPIGRTTIIEFQIRQLRAIGFTDITIVTGYHQEKVVRACGKNIRYIHNKDYASTNSLYSLYMAREAIIQGGYVFNSDVVFHLDILKALVSSPYENALVADFRENLGEEEMKVLVRGHRLWKISKDIAPEKAHGENLGLVKLSPAGAHALIHTAEKEIHKGNLNFWVPQGIARILYRIPFYVIPTHSRSWIEIDYIHDLEKAKKEIYPRCR